MLSKIICTNFEDLLNSKKGTINIRDEDMDKISIFNDSTWYTVKYCSLERKNKIYGTILNIEKPKFPTTFEEIFYLRERLNCLVWDPENQEIMDELQALLTSETICDDLKSELNRYMMNISMELNDFSTASKYGFESLRLCENNWITWKQFCRYYIKLCNLRPDHPDISTWIEWAINAYGNANKHKPYKTYILLGEILNILNFSKRIFENFTDESRAIYDILIKIIYDVPCWSWFPWLPNLLLFFSKNQTCKLDEVATT